MGDIIKLYTPIVVFLLYLLLYRYKNRLPTLLQLVVLTIALLASNFQLFYRELGQVIIVLFLISTFCFNANFKLNISVLKILSVYLLFILLSCIGNIEDYGLYHASVVNYLSGALTTIAILGILKQEDISSLFRLFFWTGFLLSLVGIFEFISTGTRTEVTFSNSNYLSFYLVFSLICGCCIPGKENWLWWKIVVILIGVICTGSRTTFLLSALLLAILKFDLKRLFKFIPLFAALAMLIHAVFGEVLIERFSSLEEDQSTLARIEIFESIKEIIERHPYNGIGYAQYQVKFQQYLPASLRSTSLISDYDEIVTHNDYFRIVGELGLLQFILCMFFIIYLFIQIYRMYGIRNFYFCSLILLCVFSVTHNNLNSFLAWFILMYSYNGLQNKISKTHLVKCSRGYI